MPINNHNFLSLEGFWENILSRDKELVQSTINKVSNDEKNQIIYHLQKMASEPGWHEEQIKSAKYALDVILNGYD